MTLRHRSKNAFLVLTLVVAPLAAAACSASNGDAIPNGVLDAGEVKPDDPDNDSGTSKPKEDAGTTPDDSGKPNDGGNTPKDTGADTSTTAPIVINEIYVANDGEGDNAEYVELRGTAGAALAGLTLRLLDNTGKVKYQVAVSAPGDKFPADGLWAVGGGLANVNYMISISNWGLDNERGAVQLVRGSDELLDVVGWAKATADAGTLPSPATPPLSTGEGKPATIPTIAKRAFGRKANAADTNDNAADFCSMVKSTSGPQNACDL